VYVNEGGMKAYVARRKMGDNLIVGKFLEKSKTIFVPYFGGELKFHDGIEIFASSKSRKYFFCLRLPIKCNTSSRISSFDAFMAGTGCDSNTINFSSSLMHSASLPVGISNI